MTTIVIRGVKFKVSRNRMADALGKSCVADRTIKISTRVDGELLLDTQIHEALHVAYPDIEERAIEETATDIAHWLWKDGYRRVDLGK